ncbi:concanavalin A-like lectin/glucanase domain-containing protein [Lipomyces japonicus]|uniref:concanavalin A-like lectin/glucanase domain-containing protein n=1 Tax=Lipomyces japonicus TaxID=56871 RepID=UPI0034CF5EE5
MKWLASVVAGLGVWLSSAGVLAASGATDDNEDFPNGVKRVPLNRYSLHTPYLDDSLNSQWYDYAGDTVIRTDQYVRLTADRPGQVGRISSRLPLTASSFEIEFEFRIHGKGNLYGDGMALWISQRQENFGPVFGGPELLDGIGVIIDTYKNNRPGVAFPYVLLVSGDGTTTKYDSNADGKANELAGCSARGLHNPSIGTTRAKLTYVKDEFVKLDLMFKEQGKWTNCFKLTSPPSLPGMGFLQFTAETGELSENHDLISVDVSSLFLTGGLSSGSATTQPGGHDSSKQRSRKKKSSSRSGGFFSWVWFFIKLALVAGIVYVGFTQYKIYVQKKKYGDQVLF